VSILSTKKVAIVTTSWDDGHPLDICLANILNRHSISGTFYTPLSYNESPVMTKGQIRSVRAMGMEIGSHTLTHPNLTKIRKDQALHELVESKKMLEDILGESIVSFCYPKGKFNPTVRSWVMEAGYKLARTTLSFQTDIKFNPLCMPVSLQFFPHSRTISIRHALKEGNIDGLINWCRFWKMEKNIAKLVDLLLDHILKYGGILHIWGHSWEIEKYRLWEILEESLRCIANRQGVIYLNNSQVLEVVGR
jgi:peptidoglycan-N-acetylglucosamine deacetylase